VEQQVVRGRCAYRSGCTRTSASSAPIKQYLYNANIAGVEIERAANRAKVIVYTARPAW
jgi:ribosomal protein S3